MSGPGDKPSYEQLEAENAAFQRRVAEQDRHIAKQDRRIEALEERVRKLLKALEEAQRAGKRQAAPFSKGKPKPDPKDAGRKPGDKYGTHARGAVPEHIDDFVDVPLPEVCPCCGGPVEEVCIRQQFQTEIPKVEPIRRRFDIHIGCCTRCGKRVQPRHQLQVSDGLHAAGVTWGPNLIALAVHLNKHGGMSWEKVAVFLAAAFSVKIATSTLVRAMMRLAAKLRPTYELMKAALPEQELVAGDETGWREGGKPRWLWGFVTPQFTVYAIADNRSGDVVLEMLTADFCGILIRDGWPAYDCLKLATFQTCVQHFLRRCDEILEIAQGGAVHYPRAVAELIRDGLELRDRRPELPAPEYAEKRQALETRLEELCDRDPQWEPNRKLRNHLFNEHVYLFTFLYFAAVEATNWTAEHAMRFAAMLRKVCGGNRTADGCRAQETFLSILRTCRQQGRDVLSIFVAAQHSPTPLALPLTGPPEPSYRNSDARVFNRPLGPARLCARGR